MKTWKTYRKKLLTDKKVATEYKKLKPRYQLISQLITARNKKGMTQEELATKIGTKQSAVARFESGSSNPSIAFIEKLASALESRLVIQVR